MSEIWLGITGYPDYFVSSSGRVKSLKRGGEKIRKFNTSIYGYHQINLSLNGVKKVFKVHRLVALAFIPNPENKPEVNHIDGNKTNNCVSNLEWVTRLENQQHADKNGLRNFEGVDNPRYDHKLYKLYHKEYGKIETTQNDFINRFNLKQSSVSDLVNGKAKSLHGWRLVE